MTRSNVHKVLAAFAMAAGACGTAQLNELGEAARECSFSDTSCGCNEGSDFDSSHPRECSAQKMKGVCCDDVEGCSCYSLGCRVDSGVCACGVMAPSSSTATECPATGGVCCVDESAQQCTCDANQTSCPSGSNPVENCRISVLTCAVLGREMAESPSSCSALKVVDVEE